uniref:Uncharacterized protein n=1 Tax=Calcidiscus leptoporus TaxID=127549 RepID=A0A7S0IUB8_9EUKA|mmetsp:Transcript_22316/g.51369  ORF Transcript_22316/g.51369 Transcript_22316/m.51369 type:complete len:207 (+) Transcript_22316:2-622(+)
MFRRARWIKLALCLIILALLGAIAVILYFKFGGSSGRHAHISSPSSPPPPPSPSLPPSLFVSAAEAAVAPALPPSALRRLQADDEGEPAIGAGVVLLTVTGGFALLGCFLASAMAPAKRITVMCGLTVTYGVLLGFLLGMPVDDGEDDADLVTSRDKTLRILFGLFLGVAALVGLVGVLVLHLAPATRNRTFGNADKDNTSALTAA